MNYEIQQFFKNHFKPLHIKLLNPPNLFAKYLENLNLLKGIQDSLPNAPSLLMHTHESLTEGHYGQLK